MSESSVVQFYSQMVRDVGLRTDEIGIRAIA